MQSQPTAVITANRHTQLVSFRPDCVVLEGSRLPHTAYIEVCATNCQQQIAEAYAARARET